MIIAEGFDYPDGSLVPNGGWTINTGTAGTFLISSGQAVINHSNSEDVRRTYTTVSGTVFFAFDFTVDDLGSPYVGTDNEVKGVVTVERFAIAIFIATVLFEGITWDEITQAYKEKSAVNIKRQEENY